MFTSLRDNKDVYDSYIRLLSTRMAFSALRLEFQDADLSDSSMALEIKNFQDAYRMLFSKAHEEMMYPSDFHELSSVINREKYLSSGYRTVEVISGMKFEPSPKRNIPQDIMILLSNYYKIWDLLTPFEREARFAISFIRIQPYEDGNKRIANILVNYHLCCSNVAPVIITKEHIGEYLECIDNSDYSRLAALYHVLSEKEQEFTKEFIRASNLGNEDTEIKF